MTNETVAVSVVIPTFRRPERAVKAARSILAQDYNAAFELVLVDNDPDGSALEVLQALVAEASIPVRVLHQAEAGVASARNMGVANVRGDFVAFLDDDEIAPIHWLTAMMATQARVSADVVFGPVRTLLGIEVGAHQEFFDAFFAREANHAEGVIDEVYGCGCSLIRRSLFRGETPFALSRNETGGEDDLLFEGLQNAGCVFAWSPEGWVEETPEPHRVSLDYTMRRSFAYGQGPATHAWTSVPRKPFRTAMWMGVGVVQALVYAPLSFGAFILRLNRRAFLYRRLMEAIGKVLWFGGLKPRFYGAAVLSN